MDESGWRVGTCSWIELAVMHAASVSSHVHAQTHGMVRDPGQRLIQGRNSSFTSEFSHSRLFPFAVMPAKRKKGYGFSYLTARVGALISSSWSPRLSKYPWRRWNASECGWASWTQSVVLVPASQG